MRGIGKTGDRTAPVATVFRRELATVLRTPGYGVLALGLFVVLGGTLAVGGGGRTGFVPAVVDLLSVTEVVVPLAAFVVGYRALLVDAESGELAVIRTYPVSVAGYVAGVVLARTLAFLAIVVVPYALIGGVVWATAAPDTGIFATHSGVDSPLLYLRFLGLLVPFGAAYLSLATAVSAVASSRRGAVAIAVLALVAGVLGGDLALLRSLASGTPPSAIPGLLASAPNGAFRGLVFEGVIGVSFAPAGEFVDVGRAVGALLGWTVGGLVVSTMSLAYGDRIGVLFEGVRARLPSP
ncbi:ABC transporter permease [Halorubrum cibi]|uniref:ABC-type transport system involved in multi-copper enzyme maturation, permease component n=1 Tax=Halorubrum cibi TaxID=413815 RepID=A0A521BUZ2_9EURY|nr:copper ABC transporter permease [Halorubrum cibi]SMO50987.1 ABC-type transport system involved in multi-copper enzyme maturation, permease component [Halorubrum cibi]